MKKFSWVARFKMTSPGFNLTSCVLPHALQIPKDNVVGKKTGFKLIRYRYEPPMIVHTGFERFVCMNERVNRYKYSQRRKMKENL